MTALLESLEKGLSALATEIEDAWTEAYDRLDHALTKLERALDGIHDHEEADA